MANDASVSTNTADTWAELTDVPQGARVPFSITGFNGHIVELQARWLGAGAWETQRRWEDAPTEGEYFFAPRTCSLRIGIPEGGAGSGEVACHIGYDWPISR